MTAAAPGLSGVRWWRRASLLGALAAGLLGCGGAGSQALSVPPGRYAGAALPVDLRVSGAVPNRPEVTFTVAAGRVTGITAGVFNECAGDGDFLQSSFPDAALTSAGDFSTTAPGGETFSGHIDSQGAAAGSIAAPPFHGRCGEAGSQWQARVALPAPTA